MDMIQIKHEIEALTDAHREEFEAVSAFIFDHPELGCEETLGQDALCTLLEKHGFDVQRGYGSLDTAFVAEYKSGKRPRRHLNAEPSAGRAGLNAIPSLTV